MAIALKYSLFAFVATLANILGQEIVIQVYSGLYAVVISVLVGTAVGLIVKYVLDKKYIFYYQTTDVGHDSATFFLYTLAGVVTTVIFWGFEFGFDHIFGTKQMRYLGGVLGLAIGYFLKYQLDKHFVFVDRNNP